MGITVYLVTGAAGFLGSHVCDELLERGDRVRALVLPGDKSVIYVPKEVEIVEGDLCDVESLERFFTIPKGEESVVIHCAWNIRNVKRWSMSVPQGQFRSSRREP